MQKIPTLFERDWNGDRSRVSAQPAEGTEWVFAGEGTATRKYDGTCVMVRDGKLFKRHEIREGKTAPAGYFEVITAERGKVIGWVPVGDGPEDRWHREAFGEGITWADGTYELLGPKIQGNPERFESHTLLAHELADEFEDAPRDFDGLRDFFEEHDDIEGLVFHHPDGRMAKIKARDFGLKRQPARVPAVGPH